MPRRVGRKRVIALALATALAAALALVVLASRDSDGQDERAVASDPFRRPPTPYDRPPTSTLDHLGRRATRRIAAYEREGHRATLYLVRTRKQGLCRLLVTRSADGVVKAGGSCRHVGYRPANAMSVEYGVHHAFGVVRGDVRSVTVVGTRGRRHRIRVSAAGGFIYRCPAYAGCMASIRSFDAHDHTGHLVGGFWFPETS